MGTFAKLVRRAVETDASVMVKIQELLRGATNVLSLAQGVVYWQPPESAMNKIEKIIREPAVSKYGSDDGLPELREALLKKNTNAAPAKNIQWSMTLSIEHLQTFVDMTLPLPKKDQAEHNPSPSSI